MATNKQIINTRFANKSDTSTNWNIASTAAKPFIPLKGEILFYTDLNKIKIGDGEHTPNQLEFIDFSGDYNDLTNKPTIPSVNNGMLTIKQNGVEKGTFTANQSGNVTIELTDTDTNTHAVTSVAGKTGVVTLSKSDVGLGNVDNTADKDKSVNHATSADSATAATTATSAIQDSDGRNIVNTYATKTELNGKAPSGYGFGEAANVMVSNIDNLTKTGFYQFVTDEFDGSATNYYLIHQIHTDNYACQTAIKVINANVVYQRVKQGGTWGTWIKYITSGNIASQSVNYATSAGSASSVAWGNVSGKPSTFTPASHTQAASTITGLATVATSGSYNDLSNKPTIPTVNNATLTIQKNGTTVKTFTANSASNVTANITVPTKTSDLTNDSGFKNISYGTTLPSTGVNGQIFLLQG